MARQFHYYKQYSYCVCLFLIFIALALNYWALEPLGHPHAIPIPEKAVAVAAPLPPEDAYYIAGVARPPDSTYEDDDLTTLTLAALKAKKRKCIPWLWPAKFYPGPYYKGKYICYPNETRRFRHQVEFATSLARRQRLKPRKIKTVYIKNKILRDYDHVLLQEAQKNCPNIPCRFTMDKRFYETAHAVFRAHVWSQAPKKLRSPLPQNVNGRQTLVLFSHESVLKSRMREANTSHDKIMATFRRDSDIYTPYWRFKYFNDSVREMRQTKNYAKGKTKLAVMIVSNCNAYNNRLRYALELMKHIPVDVYGFCGFLKLDVLPFHKWQPMLYKYKFYLAFENSNCRDYITEKFFHGLLTGVVPVTMGAEQKDYRAVAPTDSYIHVEDFRSPKELAGYLKYLDRNDHAYNTYFRWVGTGIFEKWKEQILCRACAMLHYQDIVPRPRIQKNYTAVSNWWLKYDSQFPCLIPFKWYWNRDGNETELPGVWFTNGTALFGGYRIV